MSSSEWHEDHGELIAVASVMVRSGLLETAALTLEFFESPWRWTPERTRWVVAGRPRTFDFAEEEPGSVDPIVEQQHRHSDAVVAWQEAGEPGRCPRFADFASPLACTEVAENTGESA